MIVVETLLRELFSQIPDISYTDINKGASTIKVRYEWGGEDDLNLYMKDQSGNSTPLIWLVQDKGEQISTEFERKVKLIIAKDSEHKTSRNPKVWDTEFNDVLNPLFEKVLQCLKQSGRTFIIGQRYGVYREANYCEFERDTQGKKTKTATIDHWNVITFEADIKFTESTMCLQTIRFD